MIRKIKKLVLWVAGGLLATQSYALKPPVEKTLPQKDYIFIENNVDQEYFIAPHLLDPRFTGSNVWNKFKSNQTSLGYMGTNDSVYTNVDYWTEGTSINRPFIGSRCLMLASSNCTANGYKAARKIDAKGAYGITVVPNSEANGGFARPSFGPNAYEYFRKQAVRDIKYIILNVCSTNEYYSPDSGKYCKDAKTGKWQRFVFSFLKYGHVTLTDTGAFQEIWYGTDGTPYLNANSFYCNYSTANGQDGIACKMLRYNIKGDPSNFSPAYILYLVTDNAALGFKPADSDLLIHGGAGGWKNHNRNEKVNKMQDMMVAGDGYLYIFFSNSFFKKLAAAKVNIRNVDNLFAFAIDNTVAPQSGFYQFSVSTKVELIPREYSVSIQPKGLPEGATPISSGKIGDSKPIEFNYTVRQSAPREADTIHAYVKGATVQKDGETYCSFKSSDKKVEVPIPAWLSMQSRSNSEVKTYSGCNVNNRLDMKNARWTSVAWDRFGSGYFYSTDLKLIFPMDNPVSGISMDGLDWMGTVRAEGEIKVVAKWIGVTFP